MKSPKDSNPAATNEKLAVDGGTPVRTEPIPLEFPGVHFMDEEEVEAAVRVVRSRSLFRYYGVALGKETEAFESEFAAFLGVDHVIAVDSGTGAPAPFARRPWRWARAGSDYSRLPLGHGSRRRREPWRDPGAGGHRRDALPRSRGC